MSGCPVRQVRHIYKNRGLITNYSTIGGICKICPPPPPPRPPPNIRVALQSDVPYSFSLNVTGSGTYDSGNGQLVPFSSGLDPSILIIMTVQPGNIVLFYSTDISFFETTEQPVSLLDLSNSPTLTRLSCTYASLTGPFDISHNPLLTYVQFDGTLITQLTGVTSATGLENVLFDYSAFTQTTADELVNDLLTNGTPNGALILSNQVGGPIDNSGFLFTALIGTLGWVVFN